MAYYLLCYLLGFLMFFGGYYLVAEAKCRMEFRGQTIALRILNLIGLAIWLAGIVCLLLFSASEADSVLG